MRRRLQYRITLRIQIALPRLESLPRLARTICPLVCIHRLGQAATFLLKLKLPIFFWTDYATARTDLTLSVRVGPQDLQEEVHLQRLTRRHRIPRQIRYPGPRQHLIINEEVP